MPVDNDLHKAANRGKLEECVNILEATKFDELPITVNDLGAMDRRPLHRSAGAGHVEVCQYFITIGAEIEAIDKSGRTALHFACLGGFSEVVTLLLNNGANIFALTTSNSTSLHCAVEKGKIECAQLLLQQSEKLERKAEFIEIKNSDNKTAKDIANDAKENTKVICGLFSEKGSQNDSAACNIS
jgi:ankyrin repeat protein